MRGARGTSIARRRSPATNPPGSLVSCEGRIADIKAKVFADVGTIAEETATAVIEQLIGGKTAKADVTAAVAAAKKGA